MESLKRKNHGRLLTGKTRVFPYPISSESFSHRSQIIASRPDVTLSPSRSFSTNTSAAGRIAQARGPSRSRGGRLQPHGPPPPLPPRGLLPPPAPEGGPGGHATPQTRPPPTRCPRAPPP